MLKRFKLGGQVEGAFLSAKAAEGLRAFENLKILSLSMYEPEDAVLENVSKIPKIEIIEIFKPSAQALSLDRQVEVKKSYFTDLSASHLLGSRSIKSIRIAGGGEDPVARFSKDALVEFLAMENIENLEISKFCFEEREWGEVLEAMPETLSLK